MTHLWIRLMEAKEVLEPYESQYRVVFEDPAEPDSPAKVLVPDPNWMAVAIHGGILPPVWVYWELAKDEATPGFKRHTRDHLLHNEPPIEPLTEEQAIEYLIMKDIPERVWNDSNANRPRFRIIRKDQLPATREWRNAWRVAE